MGFTMETGDVIIKSWESFPFQSNEDISLFLQFDKNYLQYTAVFCQKIQSYKNFVLKIQF